MALLVGWILMLQGVIFFFAGGGWGILKAIAAGEFSRVLHDPGYVFSGLGVALWLAGAAIMLAGWIRTKRRRR